jgi:aryl-alcohol dehydrogenase-like predicted oxidoreductase
MRSGSIAGMDTRTIGSLTVSVVGLGCNNFGRRVDEDGTRRVVDASLDAGVTFFDTADIYGGTGSETFLGRILAGRRDRIVLATKFGMEVAPDKVGAAPDYVRRALRDSLERLQTDHVDLYQLHEPDPTVPIADTLAVLADLVREGLVREIGCSNFTAAQEREAAGAVAEGAAPFVSVQNELSLLERADEKDGLTGAAEQGLAYIPYFPLASGVLTGKYPRGEPPPPGTRLSFYDETVGDKEFDRVDALTRFAAERGRTLLELAIGWLLSLGPVASVITGATRPEQIEANVAASTWRLSVEELAAVAAL